MNLLADESVDKPIVEALPEKGFIVGYVVLKGLPISYY